MREASGMERHPSFIRHGRCAVHVAAPAIAACDVCGRALCLPCAIPVRGSVVGSECLSKIVEDAPPTPAPSRIPSRGDGLAAAGFGLALLLSILPWSRFGDAAGFGQAWTVHWSLLSAAAALAGVAAVLVFHLLPLDPRIEALAYGGLAALIAVGAILHAIHPPPLSRATGVPWRLAVLGAVLAVAGAGAKLRAVARSQSVRS
ncbi:MAG TPA: hypothetical protein VEN82_08095 [Actinomycetota bacterium]|nr:hypothetical protein [Actinomycetota bacterium]